MIDAKGMITELDGDYAVVRMDETGCGRCHEQGGCGGQNIGKMFCSTPRIFRVVNPGKAAVGDSVCVTIAEGVVQRSALYAYAFPLLMLFAGAFGGAVLADEPGAILGAFVSLLVSWFLLRRAQLLSKSDQRFMAYIRA